MSDSLAGILETKELDRVEVTTPGGVGYTLQIPLSVYETLPKTGEAVVLHTSLVVKEDAWQLFGFASVFERRVFDLVRSDKDVDGLHPINVGRLVQNRATLVACTPSGVGATATAMP